MIPIRRASSRCGSGIRSRPAIVRALLAGLFTLAISSGPGAPQAAAIGYTIIDLGSLGGSRILPSAMNNSGQVVGWSTTGPAANSPEHGFLYDGTGMHDLGVLVGNPTAVAAGINDAGQVVGMLRVGGDPSAPVHAFLYDGALHDLGSPLDGYYSAAVAINAVGHVAVRAWVPGGMSERSFLYDGTEMHDLGTLPGYVRTVPSGINASDEITGVVEGSGAHQPSLSFRWRNGVMSDLGNLGGGGSLSFGINDAGQVVGGARFLGGENPGLYSHAFVYDGSGMRDLGALGGGSGGYSLAGAINKLGQIAGTSTVGHGDPGMHVFLYAAGAMQDLNPLFSSAVPWDSNWLLYARAMNDHGQILVQGQVGLNEHAYLLTPAPEPQISLSANRVSFGNQTAGTTGTTQTLILTNGGDAPLTVDPVSLSGPDAGHFKILSDSGEKSLAAGASRTLTLGFNPATIASRSRQARIAAAHLAAVSYSAILEIHNDDPHPGAPHSVTLTALAAGTPAPAPTPPAAPTNLAAQLTPVNQIALTWTVNSTNETALAIWRQTGGGAWVRVGVVVPHSTAFTDTSVSPNTTYTYEVRAINSYFASPWSNRVTAATLEAPPAAPTKLTATVAAGEIDLTWTRGDRDETGISIFRQTGGGAWQRIGVVAPSRTYFADRTAQPGKSYSYQVRAHNSHYVSAWTNTVSVSTP